VAGNEGVKIKLPGPLQKPRKLNKPVTVYAGKPPVSSHKPAVLPWINKKDGRLRRSPCRPFTSFLNAGSEEKSIIHTNIL
jgi:hypothetical protein